MIKFDKEQQRIAFALFLVGLLAVSMLALMDKLTKQPIEQAQKDALHQSLIQVLPEHTNDPIKNQFEIPLSSTQNLVVFPALNKQHEVIAYAWEQIAPNGYSGTVRILMGVRISGEIFAIRITEHHETPGLGDGITKNVAWLNSFTDTALGNRQWKVKKDGGDFDQFTGATITPRAVVQAVHQGLTMFKNNKNALLKALKQSQQAHEMEGKDQVKGGKK